MKWSTRLGEIVQKAPPSDARLVAGLVLVQLLFGGLPVASKLLFAHAGVAPLALAMLRLTTAALVLFALERVIIRSSWPGWREVGRFAIFALLGVVLNQAFFLTGVKLTTATHAILLIATIPAFTLLVAVLLRYEKTTPMKVGGLALSFAGVLVLVLGSGFSLGASVGDLLIVLNSLCYSAYLVISRPALKRHDPLTLISWVFLLGALEMALIALPDTANIAWSEFDATAWGALAFILVGATIVTYGLNTVVLRYASASRVAAFVYLQPVIGAVAAALILHEPLTWETGVAALLILAGVFLANRAAPSARAALPAE